MIRASSSPRRGRRSAVSESAWPPEIRLAGTHAILEPLRPDHAPDIAAAVAEGELHRLWFTAIPAPEAVPAEIDRRCGLRRAGSMLPFAVIDVATGRAVGMTTYMNIDAAHRRLEIGSTFYAVSVQRGPINTECKRMLLGHAFEDLDCIAVEFRTHVMNHRSRRAIERLGARLDGVLRAHQRLPDGSLRDTAVYSITAAEWPMVRAGLDWEMQRPRG